MLLLGTRCLHRHLFRYSDSDRTNYTEFNHIREVKSAHCIKSVLHKVCAATFSERSMPSQTVFDFPTPQCHLGSEPILKSFTQYLNSCYRRAAEMFVCLRCLGDAVTANDSRIWPHYILNIQNILTR